MLLKRRIYCLSAGLACAFLFLTLISPAEAKSRKCGEERPETLLSLYLRSDLVVTANLKSQEEIEQTEGELASDWVEVRRDLRVLTVHKGKAPSAVSYFQMEYRPKETSEEESWEVPQNKLVIGDKVLIFLKKGEDGRYYQYDELSGLKNAKKNNLEVFEAGLSDLRKIIASKKNQIDKLREWLVKLAVNPETRWDGASELSEIYNYGEVEEEEQKEKTPVVIDENFYISSFPEIVKGLSDSQKERLSTAYFIHLNEILSNPEKGEDYFDGNFSLRELVLSWDKLRIVYYLQGRLFSVNPSNRKDVMRLMDITNEVLRDESLYIYADSYQTFTNEAKGDDDEANIAIWENLNNEIKGIDSPKKATVIETAVVQTEPVTENVNSENNIPTISESQLNKITERQVNKIEQEETVKVETKEEVEKEKITNKELGERILKGYLARLQVLILQGFDKQEEEDVAVR